MKYISTTVNVSLDELIELSFEGFLGLLEDLVLADYDEEERYNYVLTDITYTVEDTVIVNSLIPIKVNGCLEDVRSTEESITA